VEAIGRVPLSRWLLHPGTARRVITKRFGSKAPYQIDEWRTAHGDLNWSNLTAPQLTILDWEFWGVAPRGFDAATLLTHTFYDPALFRRIEALFQEDLNSSSGVVARLYHYARRLEAIEAGKLDPSEHGLVEAEAIRVSRR
jgi:thiamine kinase-like enzyme